MHPLIRFMREFPGGTLADALAWLETHVCSASEQERQQWASWYRADTRENIAQRYLSAWNRFSERSRGRSCSTEELSCREALSVRLPACPHYVVTGRALMREQAKEIIFVTDTLFTRLLGPGVSEDATWNSWALKTLGYDYLYDRLKVDGSPYGWRDHSHVLMSLDRIGRELEHIDLRYLTNSWAAGRGWCHPSGEVAAAGVYEDPFRLGELIIELNALTTRFGYLDLWLTLLEDCAPVLTLHADGGMYGPDAAQASGLSAMRFFVGSLEPHGWVVSPDHASRDRVMPDEWVIERGKLTAPTIWRLVPPRRNPTYRGPGEGWR
jgi:hypothetical protein